ncbi:MAG: hypothetical protein M3343_03190 [Actinomycetota bacterium]|nr:hypothetical protein [Actinomycetota bacterium]
MGCGTKLFVGIAATAMLASCTSPSTSTTPTTPEVELARHVDDRLLVQTRRGVAVIDAATGAELVEAPRAVASPDLSRLYSLGGPRDARTITVIDVATGATLDRLGAPAGLTPGVASSDGDLLALASPHRRGATPWLPAGRRRTEIAAVAPETGTAAGLYDLKGNFELEGFSTDGRQLFLLEYMPAANPTRYGLRRLNLEGGTIRSIKESKQNAPGSMRGTGRIARFSPSGHELYTLYTQQGPNYAHGGNGEHEPGDVYAFVHLLNLEGAWTHCIDLRAPFGTGKVTTHAMAVSPDGSRLYVADPSSGGLAVIDPGQTKVLRSVTTDLSGLRRGVASAHVGSDGTLYLSGGDEILVIDGDTLETVERWKMRAPVSSIATSSVGDELYVALADRLLVLDATTGARTRVVRAAGIDGIVGLMARD